MFYISILLGGLLIFVFRVTEVSLATVRMLWMIRGRRWLSAVLGFAQAAIFVLAVSRVVTDIGNLWNLLGYAGGFAVGTLVGMWLEEKLALGYVQVRAIARQPDTALAPALREAGFGVTETVANGRDGAVELVEVVARRKNLPQLVEAITACDPGAFITVGEARTVYRGYVPRVR